MTRELPARPSLEHLKAQAKNLLEALHSGSSSACERFRQSLPAARGASDERLRAMNLALHDAQSVIAREYGFQSWLELKVSVQAAAKGQQLTPEALKALMERVAKAPPPAEVQAAMLAAFNAAPAILSLPAELPLVPLRNTLLTVGAVAPIMIGRASSVAAVRAARANGGVLALFAQKDELNESPNASELHPVGCIATLHGSVPADEGTWIVVRGAGWVRLRAIARVQPYLVAALDSFAVSEQPSAETPRLEQQLRARVRELIATLVDAGGLQQLTERMSPLELADAALANLQCSVEAKAQYAAEPDLDERLRRILALFEQAA